MKLPPGKPRLDIPFACRFSEPQWRLIVDAAAYMSTTPSELVRSAAVDLARAHADSLSRQEVDG